MGDLDGRRVDGRAAGIAVALIALLACSGAPPRRVISLSQATTRVAQALELGDRLQSLDPRAPDALARAFASGADVALTDSSAESADVRAAIASRNIVVRVFSPVTTDQVLAAYTEIATVLGEPKAAAQLIDRVTRELAQGPPGARPKVALVVSRKPLRLVAGDAFLSHLLELAGVENVFAGEPGATVVMRPEQLEAKSPERVLDVPQAALANAWVDPVATVRSLRSALSASH